MYEDKCHEAYYAEAWTEGAMFVLSHLGEHDVIQAELDRKKKLYEEVFNERVSIEEA